MKSFDTRTYSINDFLEWNKNGQLELNPHFQRRSVWTDNAKSYLMDTIIRGLPIPKIFIRQKLDSITNKSVREVVDGQQRLRTILAFLSDGFQISRRHNKEFGGVFFSQLSDVDTNVHAQLLNYEIAVDLLVNMPDPEVLDVFSRLNSYAVVLNPQERLNAEFFGPFKALADRLGHKYYYIWIQNKLLSEMQILRMGDAELAADLLIAMIEGIKSKKQIGSFYASYERKFENEIEELEVKFDKVIERILLIYGNDLRYSEFRRIHLFYTLFTAIYHAIYGLKGLDLQRPNLDGLGSVRARSALEAVDTIFNTDDVTSLSIAEREFLNDSRRATTDASVRQRRTAFVTHLLSV